MLWHCLGPSGESLPLFSGGIRACRWSFVDYLSLLSSFVVVEDCPSVLVVYVLKA
jgi:hypothetical protein